MFEFTERGQRWKAEQQPGEVLMELASLAMVAATQVRVAEIYAEGASQKGYTEAPNKGADRMKQLRAFCDFEREHNPHPEKKQHIAEWAADEIERLRDALKTEVRGSTSPATNPKP